MSSPKVTIREQIFENPSLPTTGFTTVLIGVTNKGPIGQFELIGGSDAFLTTYGDPLTSPIPVYFAAKKYWQYSANLFIARASDGTHEIASVEIAANESGHLLDKIVTIEANSDGTWGNDIDVKFTRASIPNNTYLVEVIYKDVIVEKFNNCSVVPGSSNFIETVINGKSAYITVTADYESAGADEITDTTETFTLTGGKNGDDSVENLQTSGSDSIVSLITKLKDKDAFTFDLIVIPFMSYDVDIATALLDLVITRNDCQTIIDMPVGIGALAGAAPVQAAIDWTNGENDDFPSLKLDEKNVFTFGYWQKDYDDIDKTYKWMPPSIYIAQKFAYLEATKARWYAVAGMMDGRMTTVDVQFSPSQIQRDQLYGEQIDGATNVVNPIVKFPAEGIVIWGQRTTKRANDPTNRINVVTMLNYVKQQLYRIGKQMQFKINDESLWSEYETKVNSVLSYVMEKKGLTSYTIVPGSQTNTPEIIANNKFVGKIQLVPTSIAEEIEFIVQVTPQGVTVTE